MARTNTSERGQVAAFRVEGKWNLRIMLDEWIVNDLKRDATTDNVIRFKVLQMQGGEMILVQEP